MLLIDIVKIMKNNGYQEIRTSDLLQCLRDCFDIIADLMVDEGLGATLQIPRFGCFTVKRHKGKLVYHPMKRGIKFAIPAKNKVTFRMSEVFKKRMNNEKQRVRRGRLRI